jgi:alkylated DNA nucleotide flippase Atl1
MVSSPEIKLAESLAEVLRVYAEEKKAEVAQRRSTPEALAARGVEDVALPAPRGPRQKEITDVLLGAPDDGLKTGEVARLIGMEQPNAYLTLQALQKQDIVELVPGSDPQRWRLLTRYRQRHLILRTAGLVGRGEFTTYGDISQVVYGHGKGGQAVGRVATTAGEFPYPHRVLSKGGIIPAGWTRPDGTGDPAEAARLLESDGVAVLDDTDGNRYAHPRHYINWEQLDARLRDQAAA